MQPIIAEEIVKIQPKGLLTIPKEFRLELGLEENTLARLKKEKGRLIIEPVRLLPYSVRRYTDEEIEGFLALDAKETKELKKNGIL